jgi:hypothetical protein
VANFFVDKGPGLHLSERLKTVLEQLPEHEQDRVADFLLDLMAKDEAQWEATFAQSGDKLQQLRDEALTAYRAGRTRVLDPDKL